MSIPRTSVVLAFTTSVLFAQVTPEQFEAIKSEGLDKSRVMVHLDHLVNRIGPRLTSSDNLTNACEWARDTFAGFGIENARLEQWGEFAVGFNRGPWWGRVIKPAPLELVCNTDAWTAGTRGPARGRLLASPKTQEELAALAGKLTSTWVLSPSRDLFDALSKMMIAERGFGFVGGGRGDLLLTGGSVRGLSMEKLPQLPFVRVRGDQLAELRQQVEAGQEVEVEFEIRNYFEKGPIPLFNVIADIPGTERSDEYVVVGGHIDSWDGATGTTDNGTGTATTIEAARILMAIGAKPRRTIRFMLWSGEEQNLLGSKAWVQKNRDQMPKYSACLVHDGGTNYVSGIGGMKEMKPQLETVFRPVFDLSADMPFKIREIAAFTPIGSDHESFTAAGVPGFFWSQSGKARYTRTHHTQYDTYDAAIPEYQKHSSVVIATGALGLANLPELLTRENMKVQRGFGGGGGGGGNQRRFGVQLGEEDLTIAAVTEGSIAEKAGLKAGDKIVRIGDKKVVSAGEYRDALIQGPAKNTVTFVRNGAEQTVEVTFAR